MEKAFLSLKSLSGIVTSVLDHDSSYFLKTSTIDSMTILVSSAKIDKVTISLNPSPSSTSSNYNWYS